MTGLAAGALHRLTAQAFRSRLRFRRAGRLLLLCRVGYGAGWSGEVFEMSFDASQALSHVRQLPGYVRLHARQLRGHTITRPPLPAEDEEQQSTKK